MNTYILCGGKNSRFDFEEKALVPIFAKSSIELIIEQLNALDNPITIISNSNAYQHFAIKVQADIIPNCGPISGLHTVLSTTNSDWNFVIAADMPFFNYELISYLTQKTVGFNAVIPTDTISKQPLAALYHKSCLEIVEHQIKKKHYSMHHLIDQLNCNLIPVNESLSFYNKYLFYNMNSKTDLSEVRQIYASSSN